MFDFLVKVYNFNIVVVIIDQVNFEIFVKSEYVGIDLDWWDSFYGLDEFYFWDDLFDDLFIGDLDDGNDDLKFNVLLGRIIEFDSFLIFEGLLFYKGILQFIGEMQLLFLGNGILGGFECWECIY